MGAKQKTSHEIKEKPARSAGRPSDYNVFLLNDDYTTMEFVIHVLEKVFHKSSIEATSIMLHVHRKGKGLAGVYARDIAETKAETVHILAAAQGYPLRCAIEKA